MKHEREQNWQAYWVYRFERHNVVYVPMKYLFIYLYARRTMYEKRVKNIPL